MIEYEKARIQYWNFGTLFAYRMKQPLIV